MFEFIAKFSGVFATIWITLGVYIAAKFYPNYDHVNQFCSELAAAGSPTEKISPLINNYPLGFIFCLFGWTVIQLNNSNIALMVAGGLIITHGVGTWLAGYFPMDKDPYTQSPTMHCQVHSWSGFVMLLSLLIAPGVVALSPESIYVPFWFRVASIVTVVVAIYYLAKLANAFKRKQRAGLYQRISYWVQLIWLSIFSLIIGLVGAS